MQSRRTRALWDKQSPALTPVPAETGSQTADLKAQIAHLRDVLRAERRRSARLSEALTRYNAVLESTIVSQREAFEQLHAELVPNPLAKGKR